jgi:hypothetical protein
MKSEQSSDGMFAGSKTETAGKSSGFEGVCAAGDRKADMTSKAEKTHRITICLKCLGSGVLVEVAGPIPRRISHVHNARWPDVD